MKRVFVPNICKFEEWSILRCMLPAIFCAFLNKWLRFNIMPVPLSPESFKLRAWWNQKYTTSSLLLLSCNLSLFIPVGKPEDKILAGSALSLFPIMPSVPFLWGCSCSHKCINKVVQLCVSLLCCNLTATWRPPFCYNCAIAEL